MRFIDRETERVADTVSASERDSAVAEWACDTVAETLSLTEAVGVGLALFSGVGDCVVDDESEPSLDNVRERDTDGDFVLDSG